MAIHVVQYLKGTHALPLMLSGPAIQLVGFMNSDYVNDLDTRCSVGSYCFTLGSGIAKSGMESGLNFLNGDLG